MSDRTVKAPSGDLLEYHSDDDDVIEGVTASAFYAGGKFSHGVTVGRTGYQDRVSQWLLPGRSVRREIFEGRELVTYCDSKETLTTASLRGQYHDLFTVFGGGLPTAEQVHSIFAEFDVSDDVEGMTVTPRGWSSTVRVWEDVTLVIQGKAILHVPDQTSSRHMVPTWAGASTRYGEIWQEPFPLEPGQSSRDTRILLGYPTAVAEFTIRAETDGQCRLDWVDGVRLSWMRA